jgi:hypothetical protein
MTARALGRLTGLVVLGWITGSAGSAQAFCRATTIEGKIDSCYECETMGYPLAWPQPDIEYTFNERGFPTVSDDELRAIFSQAIDQWQAVTCEGEPVEIDVHAASDTTSLEPRDAGVEPKVNVIGYLSADEWDEEGFDHRAFAQTGVRYYRDSGVIAGADIWFNGGIGEFGVCPARGCQGDDNTVDLPNVVTHELGHFYGLAHSHIEGATMACDALPGQTDKRSLAADDRRGMCAIYPPELAFHGSYKQGMWTEPKDDDSCSVDAPGLARRGRSVWWLALAAGVLVWRKRRQLFGRGSS